MTSRERLLTALRHGVPDRVPWAPQTTRTFFLGIEEYRGRFESEELWGPIDSYLVADELRYRLGWYREMDGDFIDWLPSAVKVQYDGRVAVAGKRQGDLIYREVQTPVGCLAAEAVYSEAAKTSHPVRYLIQGPEDFRAYEYLLEAKHHEPNFSELAQRLEIIGDAGVALTSGASAPIQELLLGDLGIQGVIFALYDHRREFEHLMSVMHRTNLECCRLLAKSPAQVFIVGNVTGTGMISPWIYDELVAPYVAEYVAILHEAGKLAVSHASGEPLKPILAGVKGTGIDAVHGVALPNDRHCAAAAIRDAWGRCLTTWGGFDPAFLAAASADAAAEEAERVINQMLPESNLILGTTDDCVAGTPFESFQAISEVGSASAFHPALLRGGFNGR